ncbi:MAG: hypothetical protein MJY76_06190 [Bacteroidales bacterium]|nr:hypothetical protein [Bacteroidales bacterium]
MASFLKDTRICRYFLFQHFKENTLRAITRHLGVSATDQSRSDAFKGIKHAMLNYLWDAEEYFSYDYEHITPAQRESYWPAFLKLAFSCKVNDKAQGTVMNHKFMTYLAYYDYFKRDVLLINDSDSLNTGQFKVFFSKHHRFIVKNAIGSEGIGAYVVDASDINDAISEVCKDSENKHWPLVVEEFIQQDERLAKFHPSSVNTLRVYSMRFDNRVEILGSMMRFGQGDACVDNRSNGGIVLALDNQGIGIASRTGTTEYVFHPDSGQPLIGFEVPMWKEAIDLVKEMVNVLPGVRYVGWDLALTSSGWVLVECNCAANIVGLQNSLQQGFKPKFMQILNELDIRL